MSRYAHPEALVSTQWVAGHAGDSNVRIVEVGWSTDEYASGHVAHAVGWGKDDVLHPVHGEILDNAAVEALLSQAGIANDTTVVLYGGLNNLLATFMFWLLKVYGHADVRLMDGGRQKWLAEGRPLTREAPAFAPGSYRAKATNGLIRARRDQVADSIGKPNHVLVDLRPADMYHGDNPAGAQRGGRIPGAVNFPARMILDAEGNFAGWLTPTVDGSDGTFNPAGELRALFAGQGVTPDKEIITYCVLGGLSTHAWFVLTQLLGYPKVREYDGSWAEWGNLEGVPIEK